MSYDQESGVELVTAGEEYRPVESGSQWKEGREDHDYKPQDGLFKFWTSICRVEIGPVANTGNPIDDLFRITARGSTIFTEVIGACVVASVLCTLLDY
jgi:hypothetical protein